MAGGPREPRDPRDARDTRERSQTIPDVADKDLTAFLQALFDEESFPEKIELVQLWGHGARQRGMVLDTVTYKANMKKPDREAVVLLSNRLHGAAQRDCDMVGKPSRYGIVVWDLRRADKPYARYPMRLAPGEHGFDLSGDGEGRDGEGDEGDDEAKDRLSKRTKMLLDDHQWLVDKYQNALGGMMNLLASENKNLRDDRDRLMERWIKDAEMREDVATKRHERTLDIKKQEFTFKMLEDGVATIRAILPGIIIGKIEPGGESRVLAQFMESLSDEQLEMIFGKRDEEGLLVSPGVLSPKQAFVINKVARCEIGPDSLQILFEGADKIRPDQMMSIQGMLRQEQIQPLMQFFATWKSSRSSGGEAPPPQTSDQ